MDNTSWPQHPSSVTEALWNLFLKGVRDNTCYQQRFSALKMVISGLDITLYFVRVICYYANITMKSCHNCKTSVQTTVSLGIWKAPSFDCFQNTELRWHENNAAYINHHGDSEHQASTPEQPESSCFEFPFTCPQFPSSIRKQVRENAVLSFISEGGKKLFESDKAKIISWSFLTDSGEKYETLEKQLLFTSREPC